MVDDIENQSEIDRLKGELLLARKNLALQTEEKENAAAELIIAKKEIDFQNKCKELREAELFIANRELAFQTHEKALRASEMLLAQNRITTQEDLIKVQNALYIEKQLFEKTLISIGDAVISVNNHKKIVFMNKVAESLTGWTQEEAFGKTVYSVFKIINEHTRQKSEDIVELVIVSGKIQLMSNHTVLIRKDKKEILIEDSSAPIIDKDNKIVGVVIIFRDYTEKWERLKQIEYLGYHDELTGLFNRRYYELEVNRLDIKRNLPLSLVMGDVNGLKLINDSFGHEVGDALLTKVANAIKAECRMEDIAARLGGDEFVIILPHTDELGTEKFIQRIMNNLTNEKVNGIDLSVSFGFDIKRNEEQNMQVLFKNAEDSMYRQKIHESTSIRSKTIDVIASTLFAKSDREHIHSEKVSSLCEQLSKSIGLNKNKVNQLRLAGLMHDIGKIGIEDKILNKPGKLTEAEYYEIKKHSEIGYRILRSVNEFSEISEFILEHHEKWDGTGYPQGLKGEEIKLEARIVSLADADDAMTTQRTYHDAFSKKSAINEIKRCSGTQFDPDIVKVFIEQVLNVS